MHSSSYLAQLDSKAQRLRELLSPYHAPDISIYDSAETGYRARAEFRIWHDDGGIHYAMVPQGEKMRTDTVIKLRQFAPAAARINTLMPIILDAVNADAALSRKLFQAEYLDGTGQSTVLTLIYHRQLDDAWQAAAEQLARSLNISIIGRSRGQKLIIGRDYVLETLHAGGQSYTYRKYEQSFSQPNPAICEKMLDWAAACVQKGDGRAGWDITQHDLLELYCGSGTFTLPLAGKFRRVLATEISKSGIKALRENIAANTQHCGPYEKPIDNIAVARLSAEEFTQAWHGRREFNRLKQDGIVLADYQFSTILVDPPRAGIDSATLALMQEFPCILYISCNPETLADNLKTLAQTHRIAAAALFDQFPFTPHIESGIYLIKKSPA